MILELFERPFYQIKQYYRKCLNQCWANAETNVETIQRVFKAFAGDDLASIPPPYKKTCHYRIYVREKLIAYEVESIRNRGCSLGRIQFEEKAEILGCHLQGAVKLLTLGNDCQSIVILPAMCQGHDVKVSVSRSAGVVKPLVLNHDGLSR